MKKLNSKSVLLEIGLTILAKQNPEALTIAAITEQAGVTKGSFYHHFKSRNDFIEQMFCYWIERDTEGIITKANTASSPQQRHAQSLQLAMQRPVEPERTIRAWAQHNSVAQQFMQQADELRITFLTDIFAASFPTKQQARTAAIAVYSIHIGFECLSVNVTEEEHRAIAQMVGTALGLPAYATT